jgi:hypothetical protein
LNIGAVLSSLLDATMFGLSRHRRHDAKHVISRKAYAERTGGRHEQKEEP